MKSVVTLPRSIQFLALLVLIQLLFLSALRLIFWAYFNSPQDPISSLTLLQALYLGLKFDLRWILLTLLPILALAWVAPLGLFTPLGTRIWLVYSSSIFAVSLFVFMVHFGHFAYLMTPLDATVLRFFDDAGTSLDMVWQSYPVLTLALVLLLLTAVYASVFRRLLSRLGVTPQLDWGRKKKLLVMGVTGFFILFGVYGKWSWYPLRWSDAYFSPHPFAAAVAVNPILHAYDTFKNKKVDFDFDATQQAYALMADFLGVDTPDPEHLNFRRERSGSSLAQQKPNIVMVFLESFASYKTSLSGNPLDPTPAFKAIAEKGVYFKNYFVPHTGTARSVFTALTGLPDIETVNTSTRNPLIVSQHTLVNAFSGYQPFYFIGGSASWGNIRGLLAYNIPNLKLFEEGSYRSPAVDVWGVTDAHLFQEANEVLAAQQQPFFAIIQTSGNHRPYTIPTDNLGFQYSQHTEAEVLQNGFNGKDEFEAFRYMDHSVGIFMEQARQSPYFDNTIFVFFGDHGIYADTGRHVPASEAQLGLHALRVPLVFYAPKLLAARVESKVASEVDLLPSIAGLAAPHFVNTTLGRDLFDPRHDDQRYAFTVSHDGGLSLGLLDASFYLQRRSDANGPGSLHRLDAADPRENVASQYPAQAERMDNYTKAIFETVKYMRYHNDPKSLDFKNPDFKNLSQAKHTDLTDNLP